MRFYQEPLRLKDNPYLNDLWLRDFLKAQVRGLEAKAIESDLTRFGDRVIGDVWKMANEAEQHPPLHRAFEPWGRRVDEVLVSPAWQHLHEVAAEEGLVAIGYERAYGRNSRLYQMSKLFLFHASSAFYSCPLAMTDGAAKILESHADAKLRDQYLPHLMSRNPQEFWTSGQWMTERTGGSDVSGTETVAEPVAGGYVLSGDKFFTSATTAQMALTLARIRGPEGVSQDLSLFLVKVHDDRGRLHNIEILRLKDKLGTRALPTAELRLLQTPAQLVCGPGHGVKNIAPLLNMTRLYNTVCALSAAQRMLYWVRQHAQQRRAFGKPLADHVLHGRTYVKMQSDYLSAFLLGMQIPVWLGREEAGEASEQESKLLRLLTPISKLYSGRVVMDVCREGVELMGGAGYMEDTDIPRQLRDAQVFSIWEGTTNVLSLDVLRAIDKEQVWPAFRHWCESKAESLAQWGVPLDLKAVLDGAEKVLAQDRATREALARDLSEFVALLSAVMIASDGAIAQWWSPVNRVFLTYAVPNWLKRVHSYEWNFSRDDYLAVAQASGLAGRL